MITTNRRRTNAHYCQSWKDLTTQEITKYSAEKTRAMCHLNKGHKGHHADMILELAWSAGGWPRTEFIPLTDRMKFDGDGSDRGEGKT